MSIDFFVGEIDIYSDDELLRARVTCVLGVLSLDENEDISLSSTNAFLFISARMAFVETGRKW